MKINVVNLQEIGGMVVYGGVDAKFNAMRVFPPHEIQYPDLLRDRDFFSKIGCPHLALKYPQQEVEKDRGWETPSPVKRMTSGNLVQDLKVHIEKIKLAISKRIKEKILDKIDWKMSDTYWKEEGNLHLFSIKEEIIDLN